MPKNYSVSGKKGVAPTNTVGSSGDSSGWPEYASAVLQDTVFHACNQAAQAVSVGLATTYTGLCLSNPPDSDKNLILLSANYALSVAPAAIAPLFLLRGYNAGEITHTVAGTIYSSLIGSATVSVANVDSQATISPPTYAVPMGSGFTAGALYSTTPSLPDFKGQIVIQPGGFIAWGALTAVTGFGSFSWMEIDI